MVRAESRLADGQRPSKERLGLRPSVGSLKQHPQVLEVGCNFGVVGAVRRLVYCQRPPVERLGLAQPVSALEQQA